jgi:hypothetical protein
MSKPIIHSKSSARKYGGKPEDYFAIHQFLDSSKATVSDNRHRMLTHNSWFIAPDGPLERAFGVTITNSDGREVSVRTIGEQHCIEDFGFIPTVQDWIMSMESANWMNGVGFAPSCEKLTINKLHKQYVRD